jgi:general secretion pathway protein C
MAVVDVAGAQLAALFQLLSPTVAKRMAWLLLLAYCCSVAARLFWLVVPLPGGIPAPVVVQPMRGEDSHGAAGHRVEIDIAALQNLNLFGQAEPDYAAKTVIPTVAIDAEETRLDLLLLGVMVSADQAAARAIISHRNSQSLYAIGDDIPGGVQVQLQQILPGRVIINNAGNYESLWLYEDKNAPPQPGQRLAHRAPTAEAVSPVGKRVDERVAVAPEATERTSVPAGQPADRGTIVAADGPTFGDEQLQSAAHTLADIIKFTPVHAQGKVLGYRIAPGRAPAMFSQFGLQRNDVITSVNGVSLDDPTKALQVYRQIQSSRAANFELMRDGESHVVEVQLGTKNG